jgi:hypothetical protein
LRAGLVSEKDVKNFEGTKRKPGEYQVALLLLASITAFPNEANQLLYQLDAWLDIQELKKTKRTTNWREVIRLLKKRAEISTQQVLSDEKNKGQKLNKNGSPTEKSNGKVSNLESADDAMDKESSWRLMLQCLDQIIQDNTWNKPFKIATLRFWIMRVARFSFSVQPT